MSVKYESYHQATLSEAFHANDENEVEKGREEEKY